MIALIQRQLSHLRWQIVTSQLVAIGVVILFLMLLTRQIFLGIVPRGIEPLLQNLASSSATEDIITTQNELIRTFRNVVIFSILVAAIGASIIGWGVSLFMSRLILNPLQRLNISSRRIAEGRYDERITPPVTIELAAVAQQFNQMAESLENIEQNRISLIGNVSHELRTPLTSLQGYVEGLQDGLFPGDEETWAIMGVELTRLKRLVDDLQALSRVEGGAVQLDPVDFPMLPLIEQVHSQLQAKFISKGITWYADGADPDIRACADRDRTYQILINLMGNALRHTPENGAISIYVDYHIDDMIAISVIDDGDGIPADSIPYLFERFYRVDPSRARKSGGSGIGLAISRQLARLMNGDIEAESDGIGKGSTFTLYLPAVE
ncbi:MAG: ATP-binding protein [Chloroflexota bacterium]